MTKLFEIVVTMSITATFCILVIGILRDFLRSAPKIYSYLLWSVVAFRLLCPIALESELGVITSPIQKVNHMEEVAGEVGTSSKTSTSKENNINPAIVVEEGNNLSESPRESKLVKPEVTDNISPSSYTMEDVLPILAYVWLGITTLLLLVSGFRYLTLRRQLKAQVSVESKYHYVKVVKISGVSSPFVLGIYTPIIYIPASLVGEAERICLAHEYTHIRRKDYLVKLLAYGIACVHWFNPFVWLAFYLMEKDMEMSCDEAALKSLELGDKKAYSHTLLQLSSSSKRAFVGGPLFFGENSISARIKNIMNYKKPRFWVSVLAIMIVISCSLFLTVNHKEGTDPSKDTLVSVAKETATPSATPKATITPKPTATPKPSVTIKPTITSKPTTTPIATITPKPTKQYKPEEVMGIAGISEDGQFVNKYRTEDSLSVVSEPIPFATDCIYMANKSMSTLSFEEITHDKFVDYIGNEEYNTYKDCIVYPNKLGEITCVKLLSEYDKYGITYLLPSDLDAYENLKSYVGDNVLEEYYKLVFSSEMSSSNWPKNLIIEVYTGNVGDGESGLVLIKDKKGEILHTEFAHRARANWNSVYYGMDEKGAFVMSFLKDSRDNAGGCSYRIYRLDKKGNMVQTEASSFSFDSYPINDDALFKKWTKPLEDYMKNSKLLLSTLDGELRTEQVSEYDKYNYEELKDRTNWW